MQIKISLAIAMIFSLAACSTTGAFPEPVMTDGRAAPAVQGIWASSEKGWILEITEDGIRRWQNTPAACYVTPVPDETTPMMGQVEYQLFTTSKDGKSARFQYLPGDASAYFRRLEGLPDRCTEDASFSEPEVFDIFTSTFETHYGFFERRGVNWPAAIEKASSHVHDGMGEAALWDVFSELILPLEDSHTKMVGRIDGQPTRIQGGLGTTLPMVRNGIGENEWVVALVDQLITEILDPGAELIADRVIVGEIEGRIGYLQFFTMGGFTDAETPGSIEWAKAELDVLEDILDDALTAFAGHDAVILDLSNNRGGYDAVCRAIAARFSDHPYTGYTVSVSGEPEARTTYEIKPHDGPRFTGPVYLMTSDVTVSCGEITTLMLRQLDNVTQVGTPTRGAFSTPLSSPLPNGWYLELSNETFADASGNVFEGVGIPPDIEIEIYPESDPVKGHASAIRQVVDVIDASAR